MLQAEADELQTERQALQALQAQEDSANVAGGKRLGKTRRSKEDLAAQMSALQAREDDLAERRKRALESRSKLGAHYGKAWLKQHRRQQREQLEQDARDALIKEERLLQVEADELASKLQALQALQAQEGATKKAGSKWLSKTRQTKEDMAGQERVMQEKSDKIAERQRVIQAEMQRLEAQTNSAISAGGKWLQRARLSKAAEQLSEKETLLKRRYGSAWMKSYRQRTNPQDAPRPGGIDNGNEDEEASDALPFPGHETDDSAKAKVAGGKWLSKTRQSVHKRMHLPKNQRKPLTGAAKEDDDDDDDDGRVRGKRLGKNFNAMWRHTPRRRAEVVATAGSKWLKQARRSNAVEEREPPPPRPVSATPTRPAMSGTDGGLEAIDVGDRVLVNRKRRGVVKFKGETSFRPGSTLYGIALDRAEGKHNGTVGLITYFRCRGGYGIFANRTRLQKIRTPDSPAPVFVRPSDSGMVAAAKTTATPFSSAVMNATRDKESYVAAKPLSDFPSTHQRVRKQRSRVTISTISQKSSSRSPTASSSHARRAERERTATIAKEAGKTHPAVSSELGLKLAMQTGKLGDDACHNEAGAAFGASPGITIAHDELEQETYEVMHPLPLEQGTSTHHVRQRQTTSSFKLRG